MTVSIIHHRLAARYRSSLVNIHHRFGSLRPPVTILHHRFAARSRHPEIFIAVSIFHHRSEGSLRLAGREYSSPFRLAPLAGHKSLPPFRGSLPLAGRDFSSPFQVFIFVQRLAVARRA